MKIRILVVDDEPLARARLQRLSAELDGVELVGLAENGYKAIELNRTLEPDVVLMDIHMPGMSGLDAARQILAERERMPAVVFCTAYDQYALEAININAAAYLLKPVSRDELRNAIEQAKQVSQLQLGNLADQLGDEHGEQAGDVFAIKHGSSLEVFPWDDIVYFRAEGKNVVAGMRDQRETVIDLTLVRLEKAHPDQLLRVHRSTLVNRRKLKRLYRDESGQDQIELGDAEQSFVVSRRCLAEVKAAFRKMALA